jgi:hypothetical protein
MSTKKLILATLVLANGLLALALLAAAQPLPTALGQPGGGAGSFLAVTAKPEARSYHVVWLLDLPGDKLYAFYPPSAARRDLVATEPRDLVVDFQK